jgi:ADP-heptose:LPS heptosyltransferase
MTDENKVEAPKMDKKEEEQLRKLGEKFLDRKEGEAKELAATKEWLFERTERKYPISIDAEDGVKRTFQARRLNEKERIKMASVQKRIGMVDPAEMTDEEFELLQKQGYELLEIAIVDPQLTQDEWERVDLALVQRLLEKINILQYEVNDAKAIDDLRNL